MSTLTHLPVTAGDEGECVLAQASSLPESPCNARRSLGFTKQASHHSTGGSGNGTLSSPSRREGQSSATSASLDADDEADAGSPSEAAQAMTPPTTAPASALEHPPLSDAQSVVGPATAFSEEQTTSPGTSSGMPHTSPRADSCGVEGKASPVQPTPPPPVLRRRTTKRGLRSSSSQLGVEDSSDTSPTSSPLAPLSKSSSTFTLAAAGSGTMQLPKVAAKEHPSPGPLPVAHHLRSTADERANLCSSPAALPPSSLTRSATCRAESSDGSPVLRTSTAFHSPMTSHHMRFASHTTAELQQFGCCVFFFPTPLVSWLFPLIGHVGISNAEGSRLYTFESSYYVREERLVTVLDRVLREEMRSHGPSSPVHRSTSTLGRSTQLGDTSDLALTSSPAQSPLPCRSSAMSDASASDTGISSPFEMGAASPDRHGITTPVFPSRSNARPPRRSIRSTASSSAVSTGHAHTRCVRIWDLKPLLMESRGRRTKRAPYSITREGGKQAAAALWERLQELLQNADAGGLASEAPLGCRSASSSAPSSRTHGRMKGDYNDEADGGRSAPGMSSSSGEDEEEYELLDAETAHFYNRNLNATIRLFRGSADGSNNSPDVVLQHHSSFSFVGFVLEACGVGSQAKLSSPHTTPAASTREPSAGAASCDNTAAAEGPSGPAADKDGAQTQTSSSTESADLDEEIHWGVAKLLFHVFVFGKWHRGERRLLRALHGGSITSATIIWIVICAVALHYFSRFFAW